MSPTLRQICLVAAKLKPAIHDLKTILGVEVCYVDPHVDIFGVENSLLTLGAIDIEAGDPQQLLQAAEQRGFRTSDTQVIICGTRFNLV
jgi:hypothetical protein